MFDQIPYCPIDPAGVTREISETQPPPNHHIFPFGSCTIVLCVRVPDGMEDELTKVDHS
jgi:hypothetical protein